MTEPQRPIRRILFASSEAHPLIKTGGLADVSGSLTASLAQMGHDVHLVLPAYTAVKHAKRWHRAGTLQLSGENGSVELLTGRLPGTEVTCWLVDAPLYFERAGDPYRAPNGQDWPDNHLRFGLFSRAIAALALGGGPRGWRPDILHCNDWQTGLALALLADHQESPPSIFTIHNLAYQGLFPMSAFVDLDLPSRLWQPDGLEFYGQLSFIKGGLVYADRLTTVSPSYAREILTPEYGYGLEGLLHKRRYALSGILNGIDNQIWNPRQDSMLLHPFDPADQKAKALNRSNLREEFGLHHHCQGPLVGHIGRLVEQKGIDLIIDAIEPLLATDRLQAVFLGTGEERYDHALRRLASRYPHRMGVYIGYHETLAHRIEAGADAFLMPSRFEPCGLNQMYSLHYGTLPVVRRTGGLADTVVNATPETIASGTATGFVFDTPTATDLQTALARMLDLWQQPEIWQDMVRTGLAQDFSWERSASEYLELYQAAMGEPHAQEVSYSAYQ